MIPAQAVIELRTQMRRAFEADDLVEAERVAMQLEPFERELTEELDQRPAAIVPRWGWWS